MATTNFAVPDPTNVTECQFKSNGDLALRYLYMFFGSLFLSMLFSLVVYVLLERPCIEARKVYKNKHEVAKVSDDYKAVN